MWWKKSVASEKDRREQLIEARDKLRRQIETLRSQVLGNRWQPGIGDPTPNLIAELSGMLAEIEVELGDDHVPNGGSSKRSKT